jgi:hypothetical protein
MVDTIRTRSELLTLYADNVDGEISAQDGRDLIASSVPIIKTTDQGYALTTYEDDIHLRFEVDASSYYVGRGQLIFSVTNDTGIIFTTMTAPLGVQPSIGLPFATAPSAPYPVGYALDPFSEGEIQISTGSGQYEVMDFIFTVDAEGGAGEVVFQFRNPNGTTGGGITMLRGSKIEVFKAG